MVIAPEHSLIYFVFTFSQSSVLDSEPKSTVGTRAYSAPEVLQHGGYDGKVFDGFVFLLFGVYGYTLYLS